MPTDDLHEIEQEMRHAERPPSERMDTATNSLTGVVEPSLPGMPGHDGDENGEDDDDERVYDSAVMVLERAHDVVRARIEEAVARRTEINAEVKKLRDEDERLTSMLRVAKRKGVQS